jgi:3-oxoacyl-(acyl-carrier-protein) synthase
MTVIDPIAAVSHVAVGAPGTDLSGWAAAELAALDWGADGLYVATSNGGCHESVTFWRDALETGLAFANPRLFPWTLSNSPTGSIARALGVRGPTYTLVGRRTAAEGVVEHAVDDLDAALVARALVVALAVDVACRPSVVAALLTGQVTTADRESLVDTFSRCLTSSASRPPATSPPSR